MGLAGIILVTDLLAAERHPAKELRPLVRQWPSEGRATRCISNWTSFILPNVS